MKRLGFRDIYHYLSNDLGTLGTAHTNLYYDSFEMFINIPFVKTIKHNFNLSLIYVFKGYGPNGFLGKLQCPLQRTFSYDNDDKKLIITNFDGIVYTFKLASDLSYIDIIERMKYYLNANYDDSLIENKADFYEVYDYANGIHYLYQKSQSVSTFFNFPKYIFLNDGSKIEFSMNNGVVTIDFGYDEKVEMQYDSSFLINEIKYKINNFVYQRTTFTVSSNNKLTMSTYFGDSSLNYVNEYSYSYVNQKYIYKAKRTEDSYEYRWITNNSGVIESIEEYINNKLINKSTISVYDQNAIDSSSYKRVYLTDLNSKSEIYCYDDEGYLLSYIDKLGFQSQFSYNEKETNDFSLYSRKRIKQECSNIFVKDDSKSVLKGGFFYGGSTSPFDESSLVGTYVGGYFPYEYFGSFGLNISGNGYISQNVTLDNNKYVISFWANGQGSLKIILGDNTYYINTTKLTMPYFIIVDGNKNGFRLINIGSSLITISGLVITRANIKEYQYSSNGISKVITNYEEKNIYYKGVVNALTSYSIEDGYKEDIYDAKGRVIKTFYPNGLIEDYQYIDSSNINDGLLSEKNIYSDKNINQKIKTRYEYTNNRLASKETKYLYTMSVNEYQTRFLYNEYNQMVKIEEGYPIGQSQFNSLRNTNYSYSLDKLTNIEFDGHTLNNKECEIQYSNGFVNKYIGNNSSYSYSFDDARRIVNVKKNYGNNSLSLVRYTYYDQSNVCTNRIVNTIHSVTTALIE